MRPKVMVGVPLYDGTAHFESVQALYSDSTYGAVDHIANMSATGSLLPHIFNMLIAEAFDRRDSGEITHFAMLHGDLCPAPGWLDILYNEMVSKSAHLVSAVVPIKEQVGNVKTSTAAGWLSDPWKDPIHVRMGDRETLPLTFGREHVEALHGDDAVLLVNTGCMLADLRDRDIWDGFAFEFASRIHRPEGGGYAPQIRPEDWEMSRFLHRRGARVCATWAVPLTHHGRARWHCGPPAQAVRPPARRDDRRARSIGR